MVWWSSIGLSKEWGSDELGWLGNMVSVRWREKRRPHWERLEHLVQRASKSLAALDSRELQELGLLYRQTASDLSVVLEDKTSVQLAAYLNQLLGRSHNLLYMGRSPKASRIWTFYSQTYPRLFRETWRSTFLATLVFAAAAIAGWAVTLHDPAFAHRILGPEMMDTIERREMWTHSVVAMKPVAASGITTNNLSVSFTIFALGITGIGTLWMLTIQRSVTRRSRRRHLARRHGLGLVELRRPPRSSRITRDFHRRRWRTRNRPRPVLPRNSATPRVTGASRRTRGSPAAWFSSDAAARRLYRRLFLRHQLALDYEILVGRSLVRATADVASAPSRGLAYSRLRSLISRY